MRQCEHIQRCPAAAAVTLCVVRQTGHVSGMGMKDHLAINVVYSP
jgi:hypothetical protein